MYQWRLKRPGHVRVVGSFALATGSKMESHSSSGSMPLADSFFGNIRKLSPDDGQVRFG